MQFAVVFSCLVLSLSHLQERVKAVPCVNDQIECGLNATCVNNRCQCPSPLKGNPRVYCDSDRCICTGRGDTIYTLFDPHPDPLTIKVNLPCSVDLVRPPPAGGFLVVGLCLINYITAHAMVRPGTNPHDPALRTFIQSLETSGIIQPTIIFSGNITADGATWNPNNVGIIENIPNGGIPEHEIFRAVNIVPCNIRLGFRGLYGETYVSITKGINPAALHGLCGNCNNLTDIESPLDTPSHQLDYFFQKLAPASRQSGIFREHCIRIVNNVQGPACSDAERKNAAKSCIVLLGKFGQCLRLQGTLNEVKLMILFDNCVNDACNGSNTSVLCGQIGTLATAACPLGACPV